LKADVSSNIEGIVSPGIPADDRPRSVTAPTWSNVRLPESSESITLCSARKTFLPFLISWRLF